MSPMKVLFQNLHEKICNEVLLSVKLQAQAWSIFCWFYDIHAFFYKQHFYKQRQAEVGKKLSKS